MTDIEVITVGEASPRHPFEPPHLLGIQVRARLDPGDQIAAIVKDPDGRVLGFIAQSDADRIRALPAPAEAADYLVWFRRMIAGGEQ